MPDRKGVTATPTGADPPARWPDWPARLGVVGRWRALARLESDALAWVAFGVLLLAAAVFLYRETRGTTLWVDEWSWAVGRRGADLGTFLRPHNEHLSLVPVAIYKMLFATAGLGDYAPYRAMIVLAHLVCVTLVFVYARRRVDGFLALLAAALILFLGPAWQNILWPFQVGSLISLAAGIGALLVLDRRDRVGDAAACALLAVSLASSGIGVAVAVGLLIDVVRARGRRGLRIVGVPLVLYAVWWLAYQDAVLLRHNIVLTPRFAASAAGAALSALTGLAGQTIPAAGDALVWGPALGVAAAGLLAWRIARCGAVGPRLLALLGTVGAFWTLTALSRAGFGFSHPYDSRYLYVGALFIVLVAVEAARGASVGPRTGLLLAAGVAAVTVANVGALRDGARFLRGQAALTRAELGAVELVRGKVMPGYAPDAFPFAVLTAGPYLTAAKALGSPADTPAEIAAEPEEARLGADSQLLHIRGLGLGPARAAGAGAAPPVEAVAGGAVRTAGGCVRFRPPSFTPAGIVGRLEVTVPAGGLLVRSDGGPAPLGLRRFAHTFPSDAQATLAPSAPTTLRLSPDAAREPWHLRLLPARGATVCGLR